MNEKLFSMSDINLKWLQENLPKATNIFNIGCADITDDSLRFAVAFPAATVTSFECADRWKTSNLEKSKLYGLPYVHNSVTDKDGTDWLLPGAPGNSEHDPWQYRATLTSFENLASNFKAMSWADCYQVESISLNTFCEINQIRPDFMHIDAEREEYNILKNLDSKWFPETIWLEHWEFYNNRDMPSVPFDILHQDLIAKGYKQLFFDDEDVLYVRADKEYSDYEIYRHFRSHPNTAITVHEKHIQSMMWLRRYDLCRDPSWPVLRSPVDFFDLPTSIKRECETVFDLRPNDYLL